MPSSPDLHAVRLRTPVMGSVLEGWRRVLRAPAILAGAVAATFALALPLAIALRGMISDHLGASLEASHAAAGWDQSWAGEFAHQAQGLGRTFTHEILGFGGTMSTTSAIFDAQAINPAVAGAIAAYLLLWLFLSGGILDRFARGRPVRAAAFFAACGVYGLRFLRLGVIMLLSWWLLFRYVHMWLFTRLYPHLIRDVTAERTALMYRLALYAFFGLLLVLSNIAFDYAKVRAVVEDRRSMVGALFAAKRFFRRRPLRVLGVYGLNALAFVLLLRLWFEIAPSATMPLWASLLITQTYLIARMAIRLAFMASEVVFFQGELAHAGYTAAPALIWPESPAAEAIEHMSAHRHDRS